MKPFWVHIILYYARQVWYTPQPVVNFIVRAVDGCREWDGKKIELDLTKAIKKNSQVGYKSFSTLK